MIKTTPEDNEQIYSKHLIPLLQPYYEVKKGVLDSYVPPLKEGTGTSRNKNSEFEKASEAILQEPSDALRTIQEDVESNTDKISNLELRYYDLVELLVEKGLISREELENRVGLVGERGGKLLIDQDRDVDIEQAEDDEGKDVESIALPES